MSFLKYENLLSLQAFMSDYNFFRSLSSFALMNTQNRKEHFISKMFNVMLLVNVLICDLPSHWCTPEVGYGLASDSAALTVAV